ncbi:MAG: hypothetical protein CSA34_00410 [Desulfobulbus propionicus]|nr:MAG: hypothetical protein CSA34_00410 [Desulfobulbus propionicus]
MSTLTIPTRLSDEPGDLIEQARAVLRFLDTAFGEIEDVRLQGLDAWGLCLILGAVGDALEQAQKSLK